MANVPLEVKMRQTRKEGEQKTKLTKPARAAKEGRVYHCGSRRTSLFLSAEMESEPFAKRTPKNIPSIHWCRHIGTCVTVTGLRKYYAFERIVPNYVCYWKPSLRVAPVSDRFSPSPRFICLSQALWLCSYHTLIRYSSSPFHLSLTRVRKQYRGSVNYLAVKTWLRGSSSPLTQRRQTGEKKTFPTRWIRNSSSPVVSGSQGHSRCGY